MIACFVVLLFIFLTIIVFCVDCIKNQSVCETRILILYGLCEFDNGHTARKGLDNLALLPEYSQMFYRLPWLFCFTKNQYMKATIKYLEEIK